MKEKWLMARHGTWEEIKPRITTALESGFDCVVVDRENVERVRELGSIKVACFGEERGAEDILIIGGGEGNGSQSLPADLAASRDIALARKTGNPTAGYVIIKDKSYEELAVALGKHVDYLLVVGTDWKVIPLENMIAGLHGANVKIISCVRSAEEAEVALTTLEQGAAGVLIDTAELSEIKKVQSVVDRSDVRGIELVEAVVTEVKQAGMGDRVCVDTTSLLVSGEGLLTGSQSRGLFLVQAEVEESPYVASRPFRVNAGAVHAYVRVGDKTHYLSELKGGDEVTVVGRSGASRTATVGRVKIERRPMIYLEAQVGEGRISTLLQNAETIKLVTPEGTISVVDLKPGDRVMAYLEGGARHFGMSIEESIVER